MNCTTSLRCLATSAPDFTDFRCRPRVAGFWLTCRLADSPLPSKIPESFARRVARISQSDRVRFRISSPLHVPSKYCKMCSKVDNSDFGWIRVEGQVRQSFSMGSLVTRAQRGSHIILEQTNVGDVVFLGRSPGGGWVIFCEQIGVTHPHSLDL